MNTSKTTEEMPYPDMLEFSWVKELGLARMESKFVSGGGTASERLPVPISLLLTVMKDAASRPEVMAAYASAPLDGQIPPREGHLLLWFNEYLQHKYGTRPNPIPEMTVPMRKLANGQYTGLDDPRLVADLLARPKVCEDDGVEHG